MTEPLLDAEDLAYMRTVQSLARPTDAQVLRKVTARTPTGGTTTAWGDPVPVTVRIDAAPDQVPLPIADRFTETTPHKITLSVGIDVRAGDRVVIDPATEVYEVVTEGDPDEWATAQQVWARRITYPPREV